MGPAGKEAARAQVEAALPTLGGRAVVRINAAGSPWHQDDVAAVRRAGADRIMLPKAEDPRVLRELDDLRVIALCETAAGVLAAPALAAEPACAALFWGGEDLIAGLGGDSSRDDTGRYRPVVEHARSAVLLAAAAAGVPAIDAVHLDLDDHEGLRAETEAAVSSGFAAKACVHPDQVRVVRDVFRPTPRQVAWARAVLTGAEAHGGGVFAHATRVLARHEQA